MSVNLVLKKSTKPTNYTKNSPLFVDYVLTTYKMPLEPNKIGLVTNVTETSFTTKLKEDITVLTTT